MAVPNTLLYLKRELWWIGTNETVYRKAFKAQQFYFTHKKNYITQEKVKTFKRNCLFSFSFKSFELFELNVLSHFLYSRFPSGAFTLLS